MKNSNHSTPYNTFFLMLLVSFLMMYSIMFLNVFEFNHIYLSTTRTYMTFLMVAPMALSMLFFMRKMYHNKTKNIAIIISSIAVFVLCLFGLRAQKPIKDIQWMKAMIPHHSSAILTSTYADIQDPEVKKLAEEIIVAQEKEIKQMKEMIKRLEKKR
ncbi:DUF305 domain-containing protein [Mesonia sp. K7]|uniref:DUF305 domain-containing protein n=1 Tax=Mesonia sp. K7 TaxID=2218606 RepID=UPI000DA9EC23|nr:DUF305 domain-containing protein [Mesonia sp. K7]PZD78271.1 DUF305 domain-containing protein [Mesonia sp. K7]